MSDLNDTFITFIYFEFIKSEPLYTNKHNATLIYIYINYESNIVGNNLESL